MKYTVLLSIREFKSLSTEDQNYSLITKYHTYVEVRLNNNIIKSLLQPNKVSDTGYFRDLKVKFGSYRDGIRNPYELIIRFKTLSSLTDSFAMRFSIASWPYTTQRETLFDMTQRFVRIQGEQVRLLCLVIKRFAIRKRLPDELEWSIGEYVITEFVKQRPGFTGKARIKYN